MFPKVFALLATGPEGSNGSRLVRLSVQNFGPEQDILAIVVQISMNFGRDTSGLQRIILNDKTPLCL